MAEQIPLVPLRTVARSVWQRKLVWLLITLGGGVVGTVLARLHAAVPAQVVTSVMTTLEFEKTSEIEKTHDLLEQFLHDDQFLAAVWRRAHGAESKPDSAQVRALKHQVSLKLTDYGVMKLYVQADEESSAISIANAAVSELGASVRATLEARRKLEGEAARDRQSELAGQLQSRIQELRQAGIEPLEVASRIQSLRESTMHLRREIALSEGGSETEERLMALLGDTAAELGRYEAKSADLQALALSSAAAEESARAFERGSIRDAQDLTIFTPLYGPARWTENTTPSLMKAMLLSLLASASVATILVLLVSAAEVSQRSTPSGDG